MYITYEVVGEGQWEVGLSCAAPGCNQELLPGMPYTKILDAMVNEIPLARVVCVYCGVKPRSAG